MIRGTDHAYVFEIQDVGQIDAKHHTISLMRTKKSDSFFTVHRGNADPLAPVTVLSRGSARTPRLEPEPIHGHSSLLSWLVKFLVPNDMGRSLLFANYIDDPKVAGFHAAATQLYGPPAWIAPNCALYLAENVLITLRGTSEPWMDLWVVDQAHDWARSSALLGPMQLNEPSLKQWADEARGT